MIYLWKILKCIKLIFNILIIYLHHDANEAPRIFKKWKLAKLHNVKARVDFPKNVILNDWRREGTYYHYQWPSTCFKWSIMLLYTIDTNHKYLNIIFYIFRILSISCSFHIHLFYKSISSLHISFSFMTHSNWRVDWLDNELNFIPN